MAEIKYLEYTHSKDYRRVFEDIATLMFCTELGLDTGLNRRINQRAIESDPVCIGEKRYAYQAKYYDASTKLSDHKQDLITCIKGAASNNVTDLFLYINKDLPDTNPVTGEEAKYIKEIEDVASRHSVKLHWRTSSMIGDSLDMPKYAHIKNLYFEKNTKEYYDYVVNLYERPNTGNTLLGEESLAELYMQPSYYKSESEIGDVEQFFDKFISKGDYGVCWIVGEPGHGKTSMCIKAVADYRNMKRYLQAKGVFWFSLNPQGIPEMVEPQMLTLEKVFSWGREGGRRNNSIEPGELEGSLVFLDGFDELKSSLEKNDISNNQFHAQVNLLAKDYHIHIIVTSRTRAIERDEGFTANQLKNGDAEINCNLSYGGVLKNKVRLLAPLTDENQFAWINGLISHRENIGIDTSDLENYKHTFQDLQQNKDLAGLLKVPILLRMIVQNCFIPSSDNRINLYRELFDKTLLRQVLDNQRQQLHSIYQEVAFRIFVYNDDCAEINKADFKGITDSDACLYQYYLHTPKVESGQDKANIYRITFIHRSFYQYFLSEFFYEKLKSVTDVLGGENFLKYLWPRHMDPYVLDNLRIMAKNEDIDHMQVFKAIDETDAFLSEYKNSSGSKESISNYKKANNIFWNAISACNSVFQVESSQKKMEITGRVIELLSKYTCSGLLLRNSYLLGANLIEAHLSRTNLNGADLRGADLRKADLCGADLSEAGLSNAYVVEANLSRADLRKADLRKAHLSIANLSEADLSGANLSEAYLRRTNLIGANLSGANLSKANLYRANLCATHLREANLCETNLSGADLIGTDLGKVDLKKSNLSGANMSGANLSGADMSGANMSGADMSGANMSGVNLIGANLIGANLIGANLSGANLSEANLSGTNLTGANMSGTNLSKVNLSRANLSGTQLIKAKLSGANMGEANLTGANLSGANLSDVDLREARLSGANLSHTNLIEAELNWADLSEAFWEIAEAPEGY